MLAPLELLAFGGHPFMAPSRERPLLLHTLLHLLLRVSAAGGVLLATNCSLVGTTHRTIVRSYLLHTAAAVLASNGMKGSRYLLPTRAIRYPLAYLV